MRITVFFVNVPFYLRHMKLPQTVHLVELARILGCTFKGPADHPITGINEIHKVVSGDLTFVDIAKYYQKAFDSEATTILINQPVEPPAGKGLLVSDDPFRDYNRLTEYFQPAKALNISAEPSLAKGVKTGTNVVFGEDVSVGEGSEIGHNVVIGSHVRIGKHCRIHANVSIYDYCQIGDFVTLNAGTVIGSEAFYFKNREYGRDKMISKGRVVIEDHVDIGANCTIDRGVSGDTVIGEGDQNGQSDSDRARYGGGQTLSVCLSGGYRWCSGGRGRGDPLGAGGR